MKKIISGKVREVYELNESQLVIVATDRISAFDVILGSTIREKGVALTQISNFWFHFTRDIIPNHILSPGFSEMPGSSAERTILVKKLKMLPYEFIVRGYMFGGLWKEYQATGAYCGEAIEGSYRLAEKLSAPILTPAAKSSAGHDTNISLAQLRKELGAEETDKIQKICMQLYETCAAHAFKNGILIADTKFEFGYDENGELTLGDELFTPDSSRFWAKEDYEIGVSPKSYDKQFVRDWLIKHQLDGVTPGVELPEEIITTTAELYQECFQRLTGRKEYGQPAAQKQV